MTQHGIVLLTKVALDEYQEGGRRIPFSSALSLTLEEPLSGQEVKWKILKIFNQTGSPTFQTSLHSSTSSSDKHTSKVR